MEFFSETYTTKGHKSSNAKFNAITEMPKPTYLKDLQTFLGMVQYLSKFSPRITELMQSLCDLTMKHALYVWEPEHSQMFDDIKNDIVQAPILKYYDSRKKLYSRLMLQLRNLELAYFKTNTQYTSSANHFKMQREGRLLSNLKL